MSSPLPLRKQRVEQPTVAASSHVPLMALSWTLEYGCTHERRIAVSFTSHARVLHEADDGKTWTVRCLDTADYYRRPQYCPYCHEYTQFAFAMRDETFSVPRPPVSLWSQPPPAPDAESARLAFLCARKILFKSPTGAAWTPELVDVRVNVRATQYNASLALVALHTPLPRGIVAIVGELLDAWRDNYRLPRPFSMCTMSTFPPWVFPHGAEFA
jgi:hypothetical protein